MISSVANPTVKRVRRLQKRLRREREGLLLIEGHRAVAGALAAGASLRELLHTTSARASRPEVLAAARSAGARVHEVSLPIMAHLTDVAAPPDMLAVAPLRASSLDDIESPARGVLLASVRDPATVGAALALAASTVGGTAIVATGTADVFSPKAVRAGQAAQLHLRIVRNVRVQNAIERVREQGATVVVLASAGPPPWDVELPETLFLAVDGDGDDALAAVDAQTVALPAVPVEASLVARIGAVLYEWVRQRGEG